MDGKSAYPHPDQYPQTQYPPQPYPPQPYPPSEYPPSQYPPASQYPQLYPPQPQPPPSYDIHQHYPAYDQQQNQHYPAYDQQHQVVDFPMTQPQPGQVIVEQPVHIIMAPNVGPDPQMISCPRCKANVLTKVDYESSMKTHILAGLLCLFGCWCCVCVPYCMDSCRNANHTCPNCGEYIGTYGG